MARLTPIPDEIEMRWQTVFDRYSCTAGILALCYDAILLFPKEVQHIYTGSWSFPKSLYMLVRYWALLVLIVSLWGLHADVPPDCRRMIWATGFITDIGQTTVVKSILLLRLRALFTNSLKVTVILFFAMTVELTGITYAFVVRGKLGQGYTYIGFYASLGCFFILPGSAQEVYQNSQAIMWAGRLFSTSLELILTLIGVLPVLKNAGLQGFAWFTAMRKGNSVSPLFFVFYRDGLLFFVPTFAISLLGFLAALPFKGNTLGLANWSMWLAFVYMVCGTRLILNLRIANCGFSESMATQQRTSTLRFDAPMLQETMDTVTIGAPSSEGTASMLHNEN